MNGRGTCEFSEDVVNDFLSFAKEKGIQLNDWCVLGQPNPDAISGSFQLSPRGAGKVLQALLNYEQIRFRVKIFPKGIPIPDILWAEIQAGDFRSF